MEHIGNSLERFRVRIARDQLFHQELEKLVNKSIDCPYQFLNCESCTDVSVTEKGTRIIYKTGTCRAKQMRLKMLERCGLFGKDIDETFETAAIDRYNKELYSYLGKEWDRKKWLYIFSPTNGTGKSFTANATANMIIGEGIQPLVMREVDMARQLQDTFGDHSGDSEYAIMGKYKDIPVLIIQDFGKQGCKSEWWPQKVYDIIDYRYIKGKPIVFTSNYDITNKKLIIGRFGENHGAAIYSRLNGACDIWALDGNDRRITEVAW